MWGIPIIGFRCKVIDEKNHPLVVEADDSSGSATVTWYHVDEGITYDVRLTSGDGSVDMVVSTTDTSFTFDGLPMNRYYSVQVRKQCHYATSNYDTTVYSPWTSAASFLLGEDTTGTGGGGIDTIGVDTTGVVGGTLLAQYTYVVPNPARDEVRVASSFSLKEIEIWTVDGVLVYSGSAVGHEATVDVSWLRAGIYVIAVRTHEGMTHKRLVVAR